MCGEAGWLYWVYNPCQMGALITMIEPGGGKGEGGGGGEGGSPGRGKVLLGKCQTESCSV
jgi:hypothetical protein